MRTLNTLIIVMACAIVIGFALNASAGGGMSMGAGGWYQQDQGWHHQGDFGSAYYAYYDQMNRNTDRQFDPMIDMRNVNSSTDNRVRSGRSMMVYAPRGGGYCR